MAANGCRLRSDENRRSRKTKKGLEKPKENLHLPEIRSRFLACTCAILARNRESFLNLHLRNTGQKYVVAF